MKVACLLSASKTNFMTRTADELEKHLWTILKPSTPTVEEVRKKKIWGTNNLFLHHMRLETLSKLKVKYRWRSNGRTHIIFIDQN